MKELKRTKSGNFKIENSTSLDNIDNFIKIEDAVDFKKVYLENDEIIKKVKNGNKIEFDLNNSYISLLDKENKIIAIYKKENKIFKAYKVF